MLDSEVASDAGGGGVAPGSWERTTWAAARVSSWSWLARWVALMAERVTGVLVGTGGREAEGSLEVWLAESSGTTVSARAR